MKRRNFRPRPPSEGRVRSALAGVALALLIASSAGMVAVARTIDLSPKVGDILVFRSGARMAADLAFSVVIASDHLPVACKLQPAVMTSAGGSLVVERVLVNRRLYRVHWAGRQTSRDEATDCGRAADLLMSRPDLQLLSNMIGGPGVVARSFPSF